MAVQRECRTKLQRTSRGQLQDGDPRSSSAALRLALPCTCTVLVLSVLEVIHWLRNFPHPHPHPPPPTCCTSHAAYRIQAESAGAGPLLKQAFRLVPQTGHMYMAKLTGTSSSSGLLSMAASVQQAMRVPPSHNVTEAEAAIVLSMSKGNSTAAQQGARKLNVIYGANDRGSHPSVPSLPHLT
jgi:hypothetical protein